MTPDELPADMEAVIARLDEDYASLLKAYQERGRALEEAADSFARIQTYVGGRNIDFASAFVRAEYGEKRAQAAINQKGDER
jgi:hypothetical protein